MSNSPRTLKVALYPYIPHGSEDQTFERLKTRIKSEFSAENPDIELELTIDPKVDPYAVLDEGNTLFDRELGYDLIEIDGLLLGDLAQRDWIYPVELAEEEFVSTALDVLRYEGALYGAPTWICGLFRFSLNKSQSEKVVSEFKGTWRAIIYYLEAQADGGMTPLLRKGADHSQALAAIKEVMGACRFDETIPCVSKFPLEQQVKMFLSQRADLIGYGESLHTIEREGGQEVYVDAAPFGPDNKLVALADGLVVNKKRCDQTCFRDAKRFIDYFTSKEVQHWISLNLDNPGYPPRYLSSARKSFYQDLEGILTERQAANYQRFLTLFEQATPSPNRELAENRFYLQKKIFDYLNQAGAPFDQYRIPEHKEKE